MSLKKLIQAGTGIAVLLGTAGTANALNLEVKSIANETGPFDDVAPLLYASEIQQGTTKLANNDRDETEIVAAFDVSSGAFPSGNVVVTATISGATFDSAVSGAALDFKNCTAGGIATASLSSGGAEGATTVAWVVSNLNACGAGEQALVKLPLDLDLGGAGVSLSVGIVTESGSTPVDGGTKTVADFLVAAPAYSAAITASPTLTANVTEATGAYKLFTAGANTGTLGTVRLNADSNVAIDLSQIVVPAGVGDYNKTAIVVTGDFSAFLEATADTVALDGTAATAKTATTATFSAVEAGAFGTAFTKAAPISVTTDGDTAIPASAYSVTVTPTLEAGLTGLTVAPTTKAIGNIARNGTSVRLPWVVSATQAGASGTGAVNYIRVTNRTATGFGPITATVLASNQAGSLGKTAQLAASLAAGGELIVNSETLETLLGANYGRGDIEVTVEGAGATVVQLVARPDGVYTIDNSPSLNP
ncbi:MAG: hypothetical protein GC152_09385 [Alphaproteobacteria bacterium]|nr:hypothetical protein [Alphaproteobacteria bacterium]